MTWTYHRQSNQEEWHQVGGYLLITHPLTNGYQLFAAGIGPFGTDNWLREYPTLDAAQDGAERFLPYVRADDDEAWESWRTSHTSPEEREPCQIIPF